jgi:DHA1 family tetracycline resistance protein-like MFS transporter
LSFLNVLYGFFFVPESLPVERRGRLSLAKANPFRALIALVQNQAVGSLVIVFALFALGHMSMIQTWALFTHFRSAGVRWEKRLPARLLSGSFNCGAGRSAWTPRERFGEERLALMAVGSNVLVLTAYGLAPAGWMMYPILFSSVLIFTAGPSIQGVVSKTMGPAEQGVTLGAMQSINSLARSSAH